MGDRVSISFKDSDGEESPALFHHWGGMDFPEHALAWLKAFKQKSEEKEKNDFFKNRLEARTMLVQFLSYMGREKLDREIKEIIYFDEDKKDYRPKEVIYDDDTLSHSIYMGVDKNDGDNSDNGHFIIRTDTATMEVAKRPMEDYE